MIARYDFEGDSNVGAFGIATDRYVFVSPNMSERSIETMERVFNLPLVQSTVATLDVIGLVCVAKIFNNGIDFIAGLYYLIGGVIISGPPLELI